MKPAMKKMAGYIRYGVAGSFIVAAWGLGLTGVSNASGTYSAGNATTAEAVVYREECGACHVAYPAGLLPAESWSTIMTTLDDHFGENAEVSDEAAAMISAYLTDNAGKPGRGMLKRVKGDAPLRITELPYFVRKHDEVPERMVSGNAEVGSFSNCNACHQRAESGDFDEDSVRIPGYGRWDD
ncbi:diheme cytochrome c [Amphritea pacifica]|uniref:Diheme cytochrome c n=1 Tax=Amphritea pacifica TaxID=2811233 RepID=A0ABS2WBC2_9GAMM|nr:diheme cytochrome c [Amphritea pacifica]MBN0988989.1 diheme cytochrome c [Amphritea pacifica]MBN1009035.1 diheme cytochrome c [Amphritea pacifica]